MLLLCGGATAFTQPANDNFASAISLSGSPVLTNGTTLSATKEAGELDSIGGRPTQRTVWYRWIAPFTGTATVVSSCPDPIPIVGVFQGNSLASLEGVSQMTSGVTKVVSGIGYLSTEAQFTATAGEEYSVAIDTSGKSFLLAITAPPTISLTNPVANAEFPAAADIAVQAAGADTDGAIVRVDFFVKASAATGAKAIGSVTNRPFRIVWTNAASGRYDIFARAIDDSGARTFSPRIPILVARPGNDNFADRIPLVGLPAFGSSTNSAAGKEQGEPASINGSDTTATVWWSWVAPSNGTYTILAGVAPDFADRDAFPIIGVFTGSTVSNLSVVAAAFRRVTFEAISGTQYAIGVDTPPTGLGVIGLAITATPRLTITHPANGATFLGGSDIEFTATAFDPDGQIKFVSYIRSVEHEGEDSRIGSTSNAPYSVIWRDAPPGNYIISADCEDNLGARVAKAVSIQVLAPPNDHFTNRIRLAGLPVITDGFNGGATRDPGEEFIGLAGWGKSVWWSWTAAQSGPVSMMVDMPGPRILKVFTGESIYSLEEVAANDIRRDARFDAVAGTTYQIVVDSAIGRPFRLFITDPPSLEVLTPQPDSSFHTGTPAEFSVRLSDPQAPISLVTYEIRNDSDSTILLYVSATNDPFSVEIPNLAIRRYLLYVAAFDEYGLADELGPIPFLVGPAVNDDFANRIPLIGLSPHTNGSTVGAGMEPLEPAWLGGGQTVWYKWKAPVTATNCVVVRTTDNFVNVGVFTGNSLYALTNIGRNTQNQSYDTNNLPYYYEQALFYASAGTEYVIGVSGWHDQEFTLANTRPPTITITSPSAGADFPIGAGVPIEVTADDPDGDIARVEFSSINEAVSSPPFSLVWTGDVASAHLLVATAIDNDGATTPSEPVRFTVARPPNDDFANALVLSSIPARASGSNRAAGTESGEPRTYDQGRTLWWRWTAQHQGRYTAGLIARSMFPVMEVFTGSNLSNLVRVASSEGILRTVMTNGAFHLATDAQFQAQPGTTYFLRADSYQGFPGEFGLYLTESPVVSVINPIEGADFEPGTNIPFLAVACDADGAIARVDFEFWGAYRFFSVVGSASERPFAFVLTNVPAGRYFLAARAYDDIGVSTVSTPVTFTVGRPPNDEFADRIRLFGSSLRTNGSAAAASAEPAEGPSILGYERRSVWWDWTPPLSGDYTLSLEGSDHGTSIAVFLGSSISNLTSVPIEQDPLHSERWGLRANSAKTYHLAIVPGDFSYGDYVLQIYPAAAPDNDNFAARTPVGDGTCNLYANNVAATSEPNEPTHGGLSNSGSVWWTWRNAGRTVRATISTAGSGIDTVLAVYQGTNLSTLVPIASDDDSGGNFTSKLTFTALPNRDYEIAVASFDGLTGPIRLCLSTDTLPGSISTWRVEGGHLRLTVNSVEGDEISIDSSTDLQNWSFIDSQVVPASGVIEISYEISEPHLFFRVRH